MLIFPAIDIKNGTCVRLYQGEMSTAEQVANSALEAAGAFKAAGASWVHMVDLDGAVEGVRKNTGIFLEVVQESGLKVEVGGGIRTMTDIAFYLENGISRVILGSIAPAGRIAWSARPWRNSAARLLWASTRATAWWPPRAGWKRARSAMWSLQSAWRMQACNA